MENEFLKAVSAFDAFTENDAVSHASTGSALVDYFAKAGTYRGRHQREVDAELSYMWDESPLLTLMVVFYLRMVTRRTRGLFESEQVQRGQGGRDEFRRSLIWLAAEHPEVYRANLWLVPVVGRWSDLWHVDVVEALPREPTYKLVERGIADANCAALIAKYLPRIRSRSNIKNPRHVALNRWARGLCAHLGWNERTYRQFKSNPEHMAHDFQRQMCFGAWDGLQFDDIPGRALFRLFSLRGRDGQGALERHQQLERYATWLAQQPVVKFTGYPYELYRACRRARLKVQRDTYDRQWEGLIETATADRGGVQENVWCALDTSGSMQAQVLEGVTALDICLGLGLYFSSINQGAFRDHVVMFSNTSKVVRLKGTFSQRVKQLAEMDMWMGSTNFQSVIDAIVDVRKQRRKIPIADYPTTILVVSDMQFNPAGANTETNYQQAMKKLRQVGLPHVKIVWWWVTGRGRDFPSQLEDEGVTMIGGFDGSVLELLLGADDAGPDGARPGPMDQMLKALDQEVLKQLTVPE